MNSGSAQLVLEGGLPTTMNGALQPRWQIRAFARSPA
jgi:hypothetical protein